MKCPQCLKTQKYSEGLICKGCHYKFALNPNAGMRISDMAFAKIVNKLSGGGKDYFTRDQLAAELYKFTRKRGIRPRIFGTAALALGVIALTWLAWGVGKGIVTVLVFIAGVTALVLFARRPAHGKSEGIDDAIHSYQFLHPIENLVDGTTFQAGRGARGSKKVELDKEAMQFTPERILIVERNDVADMLILNRFHLENKALVVSAQKYPAVAFEAYKHFISQNPYIQVNLMHDASREGMKMKAKLEKDRDWELVGKNVYDRGIFPQDVDRVKDPFWRPGPAAGGSPLSSIQGSAAERVQQGLRVPMDAAPPRVLMGTMGMAMVLGMALLSAELLAQQKRPDGSSGDTSGGYG